MRIGNFFTLNVFLKIRETKKKEMGYMSIMTDLKAISRVAAATRRALAETAAKQEGTASRVVRSFRSDGTTAVTQKIVGGKPFELALHNKTGVPESIYKYDQALGSTTRISPNPDGSVDTLTLRHGQQIYHFGARNA